MQKLKILTLLLLFGAVMAQANVTEYQFDNGLKLIVKEDHRAPVVVSQVWYKVGSSYEHNGVTGLSHMLEHMMFKGTKNIAPNEFSRIIAANGGEHNAFTGRDYTAYFQTLQKDRLEVSFKLEADRMRNLLLDETELLKEREVVAEERRMNTEDNPQALLREQFHAAAFISSPYRHPVIGWMNDIDNYQISDLNSWYQRWYVPNNATVVVAGDIEPQTVRQLAEKYFAPLKAEVTAKVKPRIEPQQKGIRRVQLKAPAQLPYLMMGWKVPVLTTAAKDVAWEPYALEVLAGILDGNSARFARELVREQRIATSVGADNSLLSRIDDLFVVAGTPAQGKTVAELEKAVIAQIEKVKDLPVTEKELNRVKAQVVASDVYERDSVFYQAMQIGMLETVGLDWRLAEAYIDNINAVTARQVQHVARKYLIDDRLIVAELVPLPIQSGHKKALVQEADHVR